ncbi:MAG: UDP-N-acetylmuramoyl-L-alanyl-D-glutamate--2,6-diaminopimelate ligase [Hyphomicrobiaceae bacterium]|nr:UDP-N-acetylmuramoyl-L-alanyl-D-glutamate--2,6-diaminopimelate ligase [Hyphomicrobiaceae bacterium]
MRLDALVADLPVRCDGPVAGVDITSLTADSRQVSAGALFAAFPGTAVDGRRFIASALANGAAAILTTHDTELATFGVAEGSIPILRTDDVRRVLALMAACFYGRQPTVTVAVTGTSGKTSVADFSRQLFGLLGRSAASIGTIGVVKPDGGVYGALTTPDPVTLARLLAELADDGVSHLAFEASSHGLDQRRLDGVRIKAAAYTNLGRDHLDYHPTVDDYLAAKLRLFDTLLPDDGVAVVNLDDPHGAAVERVARQRKLRMIGVGVGDVADLRIVSVDRDGYAQNVVMRYGGRDFAVRLELIGDYQAGNAALAAGLALATGEQPDAVFEALGKLKGVNGRLEVVGVVNGAPVIVDYAHKPDALAAALGALRPFATGRLISVFGCGGDRDRGKRPIMGAISGGTADVTIVTDDNPRSEDPAEIRRAIMAEARGAIEIGDRRAAIAHALEMAVSGDVVLIAGKGHETGQIVGDQVFPFSDHAVIRELLAQHKD